MKIGVIGAGIAGLGAAWALSRQHDVTVFEANGYPGGHSNTAEVDYDGKRIAVDTGFIVFNNWNYPNIEKLFAHLKVPALKSDMSFSVSVGTGSQRGQLEWNGNTLGSLFAQKRNLLSFRFHRMWRDILRFNRRAVTDLETGRMAALTLGAYLEREGYSESFMLDYLLPMGAAIWSAPMRDMLDFPAVTFARFFRNHGLLSINDRPQWSTVQGGSREYVRRLIADSRFDLKLSTPIRGLRRMPDGVILHTDAGPVGPFDQVLLACHGDQALRILGNAASEQERAILGCFRFQPNRAILHRDLNQMPLRRRAWASWNYLSEPRRDLERRVALTYWMNLLQSIDNRYPLFVTLNPIEEPDPAKVFARFDYEHPLFDRAAIAAQGQLDEIQGRNRLWFAGAWAGYGFHEDGLTAGLRVATALGATLPFAATLTSRHLEAA
ncbi:FAD-dependent oxidoreductase [Ferrovibrio sp. MS7]|jgi:predicted NAD/FAD-binding protein|uniref:NAD(P)/FAD-dependent oxidoreductase n=1 Tax=Ferrovibrio plantarum TaxID=3119164 RepID=UPI003134BA9A